MFAGGVALEKGGVAHPADEFPRLIFQLIAFVLVHRKQFPIGANGVDGVQNAVHHRLQGVAAIQQILLAGLQILHQPTVFNGRAN